MADKSNTKNHAHLSLFVEQTINGVSVIILLHWNRMLFSNFVVFPFFLFIFSEEDSTVAERFKGSGGYN